MMRGMGGHCKGGVKTYLTRGLINFSLCQKKNRGLI
jgi:hypothetical protein